MTLSKIGKVLSPLFYVAKYLQPDSRNFLSRNLSCFFQGRVLRPGEHLEREVLGGEHPGDLEVLKEED